MCFYFFNDNNSKKDSDHKFQGPVYLGNNKILQVTEKRKNNKPDNF